MSVPGDFGHSGPVQRLLIDVESRVLSCSRGWELQIYEWESQSSISPNYHRANYDQKEKGTALNSPSSIQKCIDLWFLS